MPLVVRAFKEAGDQVFFLWHLFFANRADSREGFFNKRMTVWAAEYMANFVILSGEYGGFDLFAMS